MAKTSIEKIKLALQAGKVDIRVCPIVETPRVPLDIPFVQREPVLKCSGAFFTPDRVQLYERCGSCPAYSK